MRERQPSDIFSSLVNILRGLDHTKKDYVEQYSEYVKYLISRVYVSFLIFLFYQLNLSSIVRT